MSLKPKILEALIIMAWGVGGPGGSERRSLDVSSIEQTACRCCSVVGGKIEEGLKDNPWTSVVCHP